LLCTRIADAEEYENRVPYPAPYGLIGRALEVRETLEHKTRYERSDQSRDKEIAAKSGDANTAASLAKLQSSSRSARRSRRLKAREHQWTALNGFTRSTGC
jgi:hypothetical protein